MRMPIHLAPVLALSSRAGREVAQTDSPPVTDAPVHEGHVAAGPSGAAAVAVAETREPPPPPPPRHGMSSSDCEEDMPTLGRQLLDERRRTAEVAAAARREKSARAREEAGGRPAGKEQSRAGGTKEPDSGGGTGAQHPAGAPARACPRRSLPQHRAQTARASVPSRAFDIEPVGAAQGYCYL